MSLSGIRHSVAYSVDKNAKIGPQLKKNTLKMKTCRSGATAAILLVLLLFITMIMNDFRTSDK